MFTISNKRGHARARISTTYAIKSSFTSPTNGCSIPPEIFIPQMPQPVYPTIMSKPNPLSTVANIDLKLRLGQPGTSVSKTNPSLEVPEELKLTLGLKNRGQDSRRRGGLSITEGPPTCIQVQPTKTRKLEVAENLKLTLGLKNRGQDSGRRGGLSITEGPPTRFQVQPTKTKGFARSGKVKPKKRDYYGPCVRCGTVFETSQRYAGHMRGHYSKDEAEKKKKKASLAKRFQYLMFMNGYERSMYLV